MDIRTALVALVALLGVTGLISCGSETDAGPGTGDTTTVVPSDTTGGDVTKPEQDGWNNPPDWGETERACGIIPNYDTTMPFTVVVTDSTSIRVTVVDFSAGEPAATEAVEVDDSDCDGLGQASPKTAYSDAHGQATFQFSGLAPGDCTISFSTPSCPGEPLLLDVHVADSPTGTIVVKIINNTGLTLSRLLVGHVPGSSTTCLDFYPTDPPGEEPIEQKTLATGLTTDFEGASSEIKHMIYVVGYKGFDNDPDNPLRPVAEGCVDGIGILPDTTNEVNVSLSQLALQPAGVYDMTNHFDFTGAIPGQAGEIIDKVVQLFEDPGAFMVDTIIDLIGLWLGEALASVIDIVTGPFQGMLEDVINDWIFNNSPDWLQCFFDVGQDLTSIITNIQLDGTLKLSKLVDDWTIQGEIDFTGLTLYWTLGCSQSGPCSGTQTNVLDGICDYDDEADACACAFDMSDLESTDIPLDLIAGYFIAQVQGMEGLNINPFPLELNYGKLILFVINELILPAVSGGEYHSIHDLVYGLVDCHDIATDSGFADLLSQIGVSSSMLEGFCDSALSALTGPVVALIDNLSIDSTIDLHGSCTMWDTNGDLNVDELVDGVWFGSIETEGQAGASSFEGDFEATRQQ